jgi:hypothetical protein
MFLYLMCVAIGVALVPTLLFLHIAYLLRFRLHDLPIEYILAAPSIQRAQLMLMRFAYFFALCFLFTHFMQR